MNCRAGQEDLRLQALLRQRLTAERNARILALHSEGLPTKVIAQRLGVSPRVVQGVRQKAGKKAVHPYAADSSLHSNPT